MGKNAGMELRDATLYKDGEKFPTKFDSLPNATGKALAHFVDCVRNNRETLANVEAGRNATLMAILGRTAIHENRIVEWKEIAL